MRRPLNSRISSAVDERVAAPVRGVPGLTSYPDNVKLLRGRPTGGSSPAFDSGRFHVSVTYQGMFDNTDEDGHRGFSPSIYLEYGADEMPCEEHKISLSERGM